ncbi:peptidase M24, structural domain-containing protein [Mycotypha africana]|uniref:peptidase M24, structural domain-containing protein n=1 Tax=Mycotypha africana TaxID=64632 RepID=UPI0023016904|nr:peptidase M24, structural domain-containing protein [Mycotypha africana]KAI8984330.1 peptidase M24, structural domain-containing protein [Mycotypha africana]
MYRGSRYTKAILCQQRNCFHSNCKAQLPPRRFQTPLNQAPHHRWGKYQRIVPASFAPVNVKNITQRSVPEFIPKPPYAASGTSSSWGPDIPIFETEEEINGLRQAGQLAKKILELGTNLVENHYKDGISTDKIDKILHDTIIEHKAYPSPLNYMGFPKSVCTSVNNVIAHGIPDDRPLQEGDIINIDVTVYLNGFHGDTSATILVGQVDEQGKALVECTRECLNEAIRICGPKVPYKEIGRVISHIASKNGYSVSEELSGHGIGKEFHSLPLIYHHLNDEEGVMEPGVSFTIEPILCQGLATGIMWPDQWTIATVDGGRSAQFEHTLLVNKDGVEILTK